MSLMMIQTIRLKFYSPIGKALQPKKKKSKKPKSDLPDRYKTAGPKKTGPPVQPGVLELLKTMFRSTYSKQEIKETEKIETPENCDALKAVIINKEIYSHMTEQQRVTDQPMKYIGNAVAKAAQPLVYAWNELLAESAVQKQGGFGTDNVIIDLTSEHTIDLTKIITQLNSSLNLLGMATSQIVQKRRTDLKYKLAWDCKDLASNRKPFTDFLFGDNMKESAVESRKERSISFGVSNK